jgi:hypothetical protein
VEPHHFYPSPVPSKNFDAPASSFFLPHCKPTLKKDNSKHTKGKGYFSSRSYQQLSEPEPHSFSSLSSAIKYGFGSSSATLFDKIRVA